MSLQIVQALFGVFVLAGIVIIFSLVTRRNTITAKNSMTAWRDDYWVYFIAANGWMSNRAYKFLTQNLGMSKEDAKLFARYQVRWTIELAGSMLLFFVSTAVFADWVGKHLSKWP